MVALLLCAGCREGLLFRDDGRLHITEPGNRADVAIPFDVSWTGKDLGPGVRFVVLIDETPPPAGETLSWFARHDPACRNDPRCPDDEYLRRRHVHVTGSTSWTIRSLPPADRRGERQLHDVTVFLLDPDGRRIGEASASVTVEVPRDR